MRINEYKTVTSKQSVLVNFECDVCKKRSGTTYLPDAWHEFDSSHNDWGNDSIDSFEQHLVCSPECYKSVLIKKANDFKYYSSGEIDGKNTKFIINLIASFK